MLYWICKEADCEPNKTQIKHVVLRNFSGYDRFNPWNVFGQSPSVIGFPPVPDKTVKQREWTVKLCDTFKDDETAHESLKKMFMQLHRETQFSEELLLQKFEDQLKKGYFFNSEIQQCFEAERERYVHHKFEMKV